MARKSKSNDTPLSDRAERFCVEYPVILNATKAAELAGYSAKTAGQQGERLLRDPRVKARIEAEIQARSERTRISGDTVIQELWAIATADANELVEHRRRCCRCCWSINHDYQRTQHEMDRERLAWEAAQAKLPSNAQVAFDVKGGVGYDRRRDPNPKCPACFGEGESDVYAKDTRKLSADARRLYAGVKVTRDGVEIRSHDKITALIQLGRHFKLFTDKKEIGADESLAALIVQAAKK